MSESDSTERWYVKDRDNWIAHARELEREVEWLKEELSKLTDEPCPHCGRRMGPCHD